MSQMYKHYKGLKDLNMHFQAFISKAYTSDCFPVELDICIFKILSYASSSWKIAWCHMLAIYGSYVRKYFLQNCVNLKIIKNLKSLYLGMGNPKNQS